MSIRPLCIFILLTHLSSLHTLFQSHSHFYPLWHRVYLNYHPSYPRPLQLHPDSENPQHPRDILSWQPGLFLQRMGSSHKKHKKIRSTPSNAISNTLNLNGQMPSTSTTHPAGHSISTAAAELSRIHSLAQAPDTTPESQDPAPSRRHRYHSSDSRGSHIHHQRRHAARMALSSLLHDSGTSGHFGLGLEIGRAHV